MRRPLAIVYEPFCSLFMHHCTIVIDNEKAWPNQFCASPHVGTASRPLPILFEFLHFDTFSYWAMLAAYGAIIGMSPQVNGFLMDYRVG